MNKKDYIKGKLILNPNTSTRELAEYLNCSTRTVYRLKAELRSKVEVPGVFKFINNILKRFGVRVLIR